MVEYSEYRLGDLCKRFSSGKGISAENIAETGSYPVIGGNGLRGYTEIYNFDGECAVIGRQGAYCGNVQFFSGKGYMTEHAVVAEPNNKTNAKYLTYKLGGLQLGRFSGQAAQPGLSVTKLARLRINMPSKEYQDKVANILSVYDNLIEVNNKRIRVLEQMAENLYREWFVRFRFPGYESAEFENGIPKGWEIKKVGTLCNIITGKKDANEATGNGQYPFFTCARETTLSTDEYILDTNAILISGNGSFTGFVKKYSGKFDLYQRTYALYNFDNVEWLFMYWTLKIEFEREYMGGSHGSAIPYITKPNIEKFKIIVPPKDLQKKSQALFEWIHIECIKLNEQNANLIKQRDLLLPRLMSGKLEV